MDKNKKQLTMAASRQKQIKVFFCICWPFKCFFSYMSLINLIHCNLQKKEFSLFSELLAALLT